MFKIVHLFVTYSVLLMT